MITNLWIEIYEASIFARKTVAICQRDSRNLPEGVFRFVRKNTALGFSWPDVVFDFLLVISPLCFSSHFCCSTPMILPLDCTVLFILATTKLTLLRRLSHLADSSAWSKSATETDVLSVHVLAECKLFSEQFCPVLITALAARNLQRRNLPLSSPQRIFSHLDTKTKINE
jgi:hypothetical protein